MKNINTDFKISSYTTVREPILSNYNLTEVLKLNDEESIIKLWENQLIRNIIFTSNRGLFHSLNNYANLTPKKKKGAIQSFINYLLRSSSRATPYGLTASFSIFENSSNNDSSKSKFVVRIEPSSELLSVIINEVENTNEFIEFAKIKLHPISIQRKKQIIFPYRGDENTSLKVANLNLNELNAKLFDICNERFVPVKVLYSQLTKEFNDLKLSEFLGFVKRLLNENFLVSDYRLSQSTPSPIDHLVNKVENLKDNSQNISTFLEKLKEINHLMQDTSINNLMDNLNRLENYFEQKKFLEEIDCKEAYNILLYKNYTSKKNNSNTLEKINQLSNILPYLVNWSPNTLVTKDAVEYFQEKFGSQLVPLKELVYNTDTLSYLDNKNKNDTNFWNENVRILNELIFDSILKGDKVVSITDNIIDRMEHPKNKKEYKKPEGFELIYYEADKQLIIEKGFGSNAIGRVNGRFLNSLNQDLKLKYLNETKEMVENDTAVYAEVTCTPVAHKIANISRAPIPYDYEIALNTASSTDKYSIELDDLYIGSSNEQLYLWSKSLQKRVIPRQSHAASLKSHFPEIYIFLIKLGLSDQSLINNFCFTNFSTFPKIPEIRYRNIVLKRAEWNLNTEIINNLHAGKDIISALKKWKNKYEIPDIIGLSSGEAPTIFNLKNNLHLELLQKILKKNLNRIDIYTFIDVTYQLKNNAFSQNISQIAYINNNVTYLNGQNTKRVYNKETLSLNDDWIYFKIYFNKFYKHYHMIYIKEIFLLNKNIKNWHFVNYKDEKEHIRVRVQLSELKNQWKITKMILEHLDKLIAEKIVDDYNINNFEPEYNRYGGKENFDDILEWFKIDSEMTLSILEKVDRNNVVATLNAYYILKNLGFNDNGINNLYIGFKDDSVKEYRKCKKILLEKYKNMNDNQPFQSQFNILETIRGNLQNSSPNSVDEIARSIVHMHMNRYIGIDFNAEKVVYGLLQKFTLTKLYLDD